MVLGSFSLPAVVCGHEKSLRCLSAIVARMTLLPFKLYVCDLSRGKESMASLISQNRLSLRPQKTQFFWRDTRQHLDKLYSADLTNWMKCLSRSSHRWSETLLLPRSRS